MTISRTSTDDHKYIIVVFDYFNKWDEAMPTLDCKDETVVRFFFNHIISRFGVPQQIISYHGSHFEDVVWT